MKVEIISVGTEVLTGDITDTNAPYISKGLGSVGADVIRRTTVGDEAEAMLEALKIASRRAELIITIGGLGPTYDDFTKYEVAEFLNKKLVFSDEIEKKLTEYFEKLGREMTPNNLRQAYVFEDGRIIENENGTAPGLMAENDGITVIMLPGPPNELIPMFDNKVLPFIREKCDKIIVEKTLKLCGVGESAVEDKLRPLMTETENPVIAPYAKTGEVHLKLTATGKTREAALLKMEEPIKKIREFFEGNIYGEDKETLASAVVKLLSEKNMTVSFCESCTGGSIAKAITDVSGSSSVFGFGAVTYANEAKEKMVGVSRENLECYGAVSPQVAEEMAEGIRKLSGADIGISVTGIAGPGGGTPEKPVGLVYMGVSTNNKTYVNKLLLKGSRDKIRQTTVSRALTELFNLIKEN